MADPPVHENEAVWLAGFALGQRWGRFRGGARLPDAPPPEAGRGKEVRMKLAIQHVDGLRF